MNDFPNSNFEGLIISLFSFESKLINEIEEPIFTESSYVSLSGSFIYGN